MSEEQLLEIMSNVSRVPYSASGKQYRTIYEAARGGFYIDYPDYGGSTKQVPEAIVLQLERKGTLVRAFPSRPHINAWVLAATE